MLRKVQEQPEPQMVALSDNPQLLELCRQMIVNRQELEDLLYLDEYAPEPDTPNHCAHEALHPEFAALEAALTKTAPPVTPEGIRVLCEVAMLLLADRNKDEGLMPRDGIIDWITLFALTSAARMPEPIPLPLPHKLSRYWPTNDAT